MVASRLVAAVSAATTAAKSIRIQIRPGLRQFSRRSIIRRKRTHFAERDTFIRTRRRQFQNRKRSPRYAFADYLLDTQAYVLYRAGLAIPLRPKVFHALEFLIEHRDRTVTKDELCARVWPDQFISDATIESCIKHVRQTIGDDGRGQKLIQTRRGFGYRFVGKVEEQSAPRSTEAIAETLPCSIEVPPQSGAEEPLSAPQAERKLVTLLGCTLAAGGAELDALHRHMRILYAWAAEEVQRYGGTIHSVAGTRLLATFGAPIALENHARLALLAALQLQERFAAPCGELPEEPMSACLALHTGFVVVGEIGDGRPSTIVGNLTVAVEALQEHRLPGVLLCSEATARLIRDDVRLEEVAPVSISGEPGSIRTYKVTGPCLRDPSRALVDVRTLSPFVGRGHELRALHAILDQVADGRGQSVGIVGEPGIGKSRLLFEFSQQLHTHGPVTYLEGHCLSYTRATPYSLVLEVLAHIARSRRRMAMTSSPRRCIEPSECSKSTPTERPRICCISSASGARSTCFREPARTR